MNAPTWAGRLPGGLAPDAWSFLHSLPHDRHLWADDIAGTAAHVLGLREAGIVTATEAKKLRVELRRMAASPDLISETDEDVHSAIERVLTERLGAIGGKVHAGRSRNDQVATAMRLWTRRQVLENWTACLDLVDVLAARATELADAVCPGYTHLQRAQPITVGHWCCAHAWALLRDVERFTGAFAACNVSPLGAGALAGSTLGIDPTVARDALGFDRVFMNTLDAVSDRDYLCDATYAAAMTATHLSRLAEEIVLWSSAEFGFVELPDDHATGSSMMPQKKNPDVAELTRGQTGPVVGALVGLLSTLKGLHLAYDRDLQADKENVAGALGVVTASLRAMAGLMSGIRFDSVRMAEAAGDDLALATDVAEALVRAGVSFRDAHHRVGTLARSAVHEGTTLADAIRSAPDSVAPLGVGAALSLLGPAGAVRRRDLPGGPAPKRVRAQARSIQRASLRGRRAAAAASERSTGQA